MLLAVTVHYGAPIPVGLVSPLLPKPTGGRRLMHGGEQRAARGVAGRGSLAGGARDNFGDKQEAAMAGSFPPSPAPISSLLHPPPAAQICRPPPPPTSPPENLSAARHFEQPPPSSARNQPAIL
ncbi:hypothetical protein Droror1_Dr00025562 [Drosera rotundifolia]